MDNQVTNAAKDTDSMAKTFGCVLGGRNQVCSFRDWKLFENSDEWKFKEFLESSYYQDSFRRHQIQKFSSEHFTTNSEFWTETFKEEIELVDAEDHKVEKRGGAILKAQFGDFAKSGFIFTEQNQSLSNWLVHKKEEALDC